jgi:hypothetical protein
MLKVALDAGSVVLSSCEYEDVEVTRPFHAKKQRKIAFAIKMLAKKSPAATFAKLER